MVALMLAVPGTLGGCKKSASTPGADADPEVEPPEQEEPNDDTDEIPDDTDDTPDTPDDNESDDPIDTPDEEVELPCDQGGSCAEGTRCIDHVCQRADECDDSRACTFGRICATAVNGGVCLRDCREGGEGPGADAICKEFREDLVCHRRAFGQCARPCDGGTAGDEFCRGFHPLFRCDGTIRRCVPAEEADCAADCAPGTVCHSEVTGGRCLRACTVGDFGREGDAYCRYLDPATLCDPALGGRCVKPCVAGAGIQDDSCAQRDPNLRCTPSGRCAPATAGAECEHPDDCPRGLVCERPVHHGADTDPPPPGHCLPGCTGAGAGADALCDERYPRSGPQDPPVCHVRLQNDQGVCANRCDDDADCTKLGPELVCNREGHCIPRAATLACRADVDCRAGEVCHAQVGSGTCGPPCETGIARGGVMLTGNGFCETLIAGGAPGNLVCHREAAPGGRCAPRCLNDAFDCGVFRLADADAPPLQCRADGLCSARESADECDRAQTRPCPTGSFCHWSILGGRCAPSCGAGRPGVDPVDANRTQPVRGDLFCTVDLGPNTVCQANGLCRPRCRDESDCAAGEYCATSGRCESTTRPSTCSSDADCAFGDICHPPGVLGAPPGHCAPPCGRDADCAMVGTDGSSRRCRNPHPGLPPALLARNGEISSEAGGRCTIQGPSPCTQDADCGLGTVCHRPGTPEAVCAAPCTGDDGCRVRFPELPSGALRCVNTGALPPPWAMPTSGEIPSSFPGRCVAAALTFTPCAATSDCGTGEVCHPLAGSETGSPNGSRCGLPCENDAACAALGAEGEWRCAAPTDAPGIGSARGGLCVAASALRSEANPTGLCPRGEVAHSRLPGAPCGPPCRADADCASRESSESGALYCANARDLTMSEATLPAWGVCRPRSDIAGCNTALDCPAGEICHVQLSGLHGERGLCAPPCPTGTTCGELGADIRCVGGDQCRGGEAESPCQGDFDCPFRQYCLDYAGVRQCRSACERDTDCPSGATCLANGRCRDLAARPGTCATDADCGSGLRCDPGGYCKPEGGAPVCRSDAECPLGQLCSAEAHTHGVCQAPCASAADCFADAPLCAADGRCRASIAQPTGCRGFAAYCGPGLVCHDNDGDGVCAPPCAADADCSAAAGRPLGRCAAILESSGTATRALDPAAGVCVPSDRFTRRCDRGGPCPWGQLCHEELDTPQCAPACAADTDCTRALGPGFACRAGGFCAPAVAEEGCAGDGDCGVGERCHPLATPTGLCAPDCDTDADCAAVAANTRCDAFGLCRRTPAVVDCGSDADCAAFASDAVCNRGRCAEGLSGGLCKMDGDCAVGMRCHGGLGPRMDVGGCQPPCDDMGYCTALDRFTACRATRLCERTSTVQTECAVDGDCLVGQVCHAQARTGGICAPACDSPADCGVLGSGLFCNAFGHCTPRP